MLVYGDIERDEWPSAVRASIAELLGSAERQQAGLERHATLVGAFIRAGELVQGIADGEFGRQGCDARSHRQDMGAQLLFSLAKAIDRSWLTGFQDRLPLLPTASPLLNQLDWPEPIRIRRPEGYALYALYPETYLVAAQLSGLGPATRVIGVRSIGTGLSALVAAALKAQPPITVRPTGHPFRRRIDAAPGLTAEFAAHAAPCAVVDEGPGLSGSSFAAVAGWLEQGGVAPRHIHFFPSHEGEPGPEASPETTRRWAGRPRHVLGFEAAFIRTPKREHRLDSWVADLVGPLDGPLQDISGGEWRQLRYPDERRWPPVDARLERRKFLARSGRTKWLVKFAGLGEDGARKLGTARCLGRAGFTPEVAGLRHGFIIERWVEGGPLDGTVDRDRFLENLGRYLGFRACHLEASCPGASLEKLARMTRCNLEGTLHSEATDRLDRLLGNAAAHQTRLHRIDSDNRLHSWEWIAGADGRLIKTDALDHSSAHDLVGMQDVTWDIAGAAVEHGLSPEETTMLCRIVAESCGRPIDPGLLAFMTACYCAFQLGLWTFATGSAAEAERSGLEKFCRRYVHALSGLLDRVG